MTDAEFNELLTAVAKRLATLADMAHETREQAQHVLDRLTLLREDINALKYRLKQATRAQESKNGASSNS